MLYVFHVETGTMMTFEMGLAVESVNNLKEYIEKVCKIPVDKQVLLINGGECLDSNSKVLSYSAGTDTNPIFLFNKAIIQSQTPPIASVDYGSDFDFTRKVSEAVNLPPTFSAVEQRAKLAQQFYEIDREQEKICERLVYDQHLQQQGWAAVVANLEEIAAVFKRRAENFEKIFEAHIKEHNVYLESLNEFHADLKTLEQIPILSTLLENNQAFETEADQEGNDGDDDDDDGDESEPAETATKKNLTLYEWISAADNGNSIDKLYEHCQNGLTQVNKTIFDRLHDEIEKAIQNSEQPDLREIKGLSDRLCGLEQLMVEAKECVQSQQNHAASFQQNQARCGNLRDPSLLPDLCASHITQLHSMLRNHTQVCDIRRRCMKAKEELSVNLYHRLKWVMYVESQIQDTDHNLVICHENLKRLRLNLEVIQQIHSAPAMYMSAIAEVMRRRTFSQAFLLWASELACHLLTTHNEEVTRRKEFQSQFEGHFLNALFPGMADLPPSFATQAPSIFDSSLPKITVDDIERLKSELPELADGLTVPDLSGINFFMIKSLKIESDKADDAGIEEKLVRAVNDVGLASNIDVNLLKPNESETCLAMSPNVAQTKHVERCCDSEMDIDEFEKLCQSPLELNFDKEIQSDRPETQDASTLTEDNLETSRTEQDRLKLVLTKVSQLTKETTSQLRSELDNFKKYFVLERINLESQCESLTNSFEILCTEHGNNKREIVQRMTVDHELEMSDCRKVMVRRCEEVDLLKDNYVDLENKYRKCLEDIDGLRAVEERLRAEMQTTVDAYESKLKEADAERARAVKETADAMTRGHKVELENLRAKFRLVTTTPTTTPATSPIADADRADVELAKQRYELDKEAIIASEADKWRATLNEEIVRLKADFEVERGALINEMSQRRNDDKEKQIEMLRERERNLKLEVIKYKSTIEQILKTEVVSGDGGVGSDSDLLDRIETLEREKCQLEAELSEERSRRLTTTHTTATSMSTSVAVCEGKVDAATSPKRHRDRLTRSQTSLVKCGKLSLDSCNKGDKVLVVWDKDHQKYMILQENDYLFFLNSDCLECLGLKDQTDDERIMYCTCEVVDKEFCFAKKAENRYNVPVGTKFYRVKVKPLMSPLLCSSQESSVFASASSSAVTTVTTTSSQMSQSQVVARVQQQELLVASGQESRTASGTSTPLQEENNEECNRRWFHFLRKFSNDSNDFLSDFY